MRIDHIAYRVADRNRTADFFKSAFGYKTQTEFDITFSDGSTARCIALEPPEKLDNKIRFVYTAYELFIDNVDNWNHRWVSYHLAPEIFVSDGTPDSIVGKWVAQRSAVGGIHHLAYQVDDVQKQMDEWREKGYAEFATESPLVCPGLTQVFTKPSQLTGVVYEFINRANRAAHGFCKENVKDLMVSTGDFK